MTRTCASVRKHLGGYADGELESVLRHRVSAHLAGCDACGEALQEIRAIGDLLRTDAVAPVDHTELAGLAAGVISRVRAEEAQSWRAMVRRATGDWHWALVGSGAVTAAVASIAIVAAIWQFVPGHGREDSLAAMLKNFERPAGTMVVIATPVGRDQMPMLMQVNGPSDAITRAIDPLTLPAGFSGPSEGELAFALANAVVRPDGRVGDLRSMSHRARAQTQAILDEMQRQGVVNVATWSSRRVSIVRVGFMTSANVTAKSL
jgi:anti-sigma factor RsiW